MHRLAALADLNGDARLEAVVQGTYYEGTGTAVFEMQPDGTLTAVLQSGCGA